MEHEKIKRLLERYWQAETSLEEEKELADYFRGEDIDASLVRYRPFFEYVEEEGKVEAGVDFEAKILARIGEMEPAAGARVRRLRFGSVAAAAVLLCVCSLFLVVQFSGKGGDSVVKDTYSDPEQALAAVRRALLMASAHMNEGKSITQKNIHRLDNSWQAAGFK